jgi:hypothetical protein
MDSPVQTLIAAHRRAALLLRDAENTARNWPDDKVARYRAHQAAAAETEAFATLVGMVRLLMPEGLIQALRYGCTVSARKPPQGDIDHDRGLLAMVVLALASDLEDAGNDDDQPTPA